MMNFIYFIIAVISGYLTLILIVLLWRILKAPKWAMDEARNQSLGFKETLNGKTNEHADSRYKENTADFHIQTVDGKPRIIVDPQSKASLELVGHIIGND
ncbi:MAG: hypothetical protein AB8B77_08745 [Alphaproteobacteria bacterium]